MTPKPPMERLAEIARIFKRAARRAKSAKNMNDSSVTPFHAKELNRIYELARTEPQPKCPEYEQRSKCRVCTHNWHYNRLEGHARLLREERGHCYMFREIQVPCAQWKPAPPQGKEA